MKSVLIALLSVGVASSIGAAEDSPLKSTKEKNSYALGVTIGNQLKQIEADIDVETYAKGLKHALGGEKTLLTEEQLRETMTAFQTEVRNKQAEQRTKMQEKNKKEGDAFLAQNKTKEGIITTASGLQYKVETKGTGKIPGSNDTVVCHYRGTLINGEEFDSSYKRGEPTSFRVGGVIKGWTEALLMMPVGSKWKLFIPSELAYGERGNRNIPPNSTLLFDIELISIKDPAEAGAASKPIQIQPQIAPADKPK